MHSLTCVFKGGYMYSVMLLTPIDNVKNNRVINKEMVFTNTYEWDNEIDVATNDLTELTRKKVCDVSIYRDKILINHSFHVIIHMFSSSTISV